jgi:hypothetical protein
VLAVASAVAFIIAVIIIAVDKIGTGFGNPLLWIGVGGALLALHLVVPVGTWAIGRRTTP